MTNSLRKENTEDTEVMKTVINNILKDTGFQYHKYIEKKGKTN